MKDFVPDIFASLSALFCISLGSAAAQQSKAQPDVDAVALFNGTVTGGNHYLLADISAQQQLSTGRYHAGSRHSDRQTISREEF